MVSCRRCGKEGWRFHMGVVEGKWYCVACYPVMRKGEAPYSPEIERELEEFLACRRAHLEFIRHLAARGVLNEGLGDNEASAI